MYRPIPTIYPIHLFIPVRLLQMRTGSVTVSTEGTEQRPAGCAHGSVPDDIRPTQVLQRLSAGGAQQQPSEEEERHSPEQELW